MGIGLLCWNLYLTYNVMHTPSNENESHVQKTDEGITIVQNTLNGYTTDLTKTVSNVSSSLVTIQGEELYQTGMIYAVDQEGVYVVSAYANVKDKDGLLVRFDNGMEYVASLVGFDEMSDICVLHVVPDFSCTKMSIGDSDLVKHGEYTIALGSKYKNTEAGFVSFGVVSKTAQVEVQKEDASWILSTLRSDVKGHDCFIGGPLVNLSGQMIGMVTSFEEDGFVSAVVSDEFVLIVDQLIETGSVHRGYLGAIVGDMQEVAVYQKSAMNIPLDQTSGLLVYDVLHGDVLKYGDVILKVDNKDMLAVDDLREILYEYKSEDELEFVVLREGSEVRLTVVLDD